jgi:hypothetical protein
MISFYGRKLQIFSPQILSGLASFIHLKLWKLEFRMQYLSETTLNDSNQFRRHWNKCFGELHGKSALFIPAKSLSCRALHVSTKIQVSLRCSTCTKLLISFFRSWLQILSLRTYVFCPQLCFPCEILQTGILTCNAYIYMLCWSFWFFPLPSLFLFIILSCSLTSKMLSFLSCTLVLPHKIKSEFFILLVIFGFLAPIWTVCKLFSKQFSDYWYWELFKTEFFL